MNISLGSRLAITFADYYRNILHTKGTLTIVVVIIGAISTCNVEKSLSDNMDLQDSRMPAAGGRGPKAENKRTEQHVISW